MFLFNGISNFYDIYVKYRTLDKFPLKFVSYHFKQCLSVHVSVRHVSFHVCPLSVHPSVNQVLGSKLKKEQAKRAIPLHRCLHSSCFRKSNLSLSWLHNYFSGFHPLGAILPSGNFFFPLFQPTLVPETLVKIKSKAMIGHDTLFF